MSLHWNDDGLVEESKGNCFGDCSLFSSPAAELHPFGGIESARDLRMESVGEDHFFGWGDVILREGASLEELLDGYVAELERLLEVPVRWQRVVRNEPALVLRGRIGEISTDPELDDTPTLHLFTDEKDPSPDTGAGFASATDGPALARRLERFLGVPVVDETVGPAVDPFTVRLHTSAARTSMLETVAEKIEEQSDLEVVLEDRPVDVVQIVVGEG